MIVLPRAARKFMGAALSLSLIGWESPAGAACAVGSAHATQISSRVFSDQALMLPVMNALQPETHTASTYALGREIYRKDPGLFARHLAILKTLNQEDVIEQRRELSGKPRRHELHRRMIELFIAPVHEGHPSRWSHPEASHRRMTQAVRAIEFYIERGSMDAARWLFVQFIESQLFMTMDAAERLLKLRYATEPTPRIDQPGFFEAMHFLINHADPANVMTLGNPEEAWDDDIVVSDLNGVMRRLSSQLRASGLMSVRDILRNTRTSVPSMSAADIEKEKFLEFIQPIKGATDGELMMTAKGDRIQVGLIRYSLRRQERFAWIILEEKGLHLVGIIPVSVDKLPGGGIRVGHPKIPDGGLRVNHRDYLRASVTLALRQHRIMEWEFSAQPTEAEKRTLGDMLFDRQLDIQQVNGQTRVTHGTGALVDDLLRLNVLADYLHDQTQQFLQKWNSAEPGFRFEMTQEILVPIRNAASALEEGLRMEMADRNPKALRQRISGLESRLTWLEGFLALVGDQAILDQAMRSDDVEGNSGPSEWLLGSLYHAVLRLHAPSYAAYRDYIESYRRLLVKFKPLVQAA